MPQYKNDAEMISSIGCLDSEFIKPTPHYVISKVFEYLPEILVFRELSSLWLDLCLLDLNFCRRKVRWARKGEEAPQRFKEALYWFKRAGQHLEELESCEIVIPFNTIACQDDISKSHNKKAGRELKSFLHQQPLTPASCFPRSASVSPVKLFQYRGEAAIQWQERQSQGQPPGGMSASSAL